MDIKLLHDIALANVANPDAAYFYRSVCRWYSKTFNTPLTVVETLAPEHVLINYFESIFEDADEDKMWEEMNRAVDPDFDNNEEEEVQDFIKLIEAEEKNKTASKAVNSKQSLGKEPGVTPRIVTKSKTFQEERPPEDIGDGLDGLDDIAKGFDNE